MDEPKKKASWASQVPPAQTPFGLFAKHAHLPVQYANVNDKGAVAINVPKTWRQHNVAIPHTLHITRFNQCEPFSKAFRNPNEPGRAMILWLDANILGPSPHSDTIDDAWKTRLRGQAAQFAQHLAEDRQLGKVESRLYFPDAEFRRMTGHKIGAALVLVTSKAEAHRISDLPVHLGKVQKAEKKRPIPEPWKGWVERSQHPLDLRDFLSYQTGPLEIFDNPVHQSTVTLKNPLTGVPHDIPIDYLPTEHTPTAGLAMWLSPSSVPPSNQRRFGHENSKAFLASADELARFASYLKQETDTDFDVLRLLPQKNVNEPYPVLIFAHGPHQKRALQDAKSLLEDEITLLREEVPDEVARLQSDSKAKGSGLAP